MRFRVFSRGSFVNERLWYRFSLLWDKFSICRLVSGTNCELLIVCEMLLWFRRRYWRRESWVNIFGWIVIRLFRDRFKVKLRFL